MAFSTNFHDDSFDCRTALKTLKDLLRWLSLRQSWEETIPMSECDSVAKTWDLFSHQDNIYVEITTGMNGQSLLHHFPGLSTLPVMPGEQQSKLGMSPCQGQKFYFGPFNEDLKNL